MSNRQISALLLIFANLVLCGTSVFDMYKEAGRMNWISVTVGIMNGLCALALAACWGFF